MADSSAASRLDDLVLELDLIVYALERPAPADDDDATRERARNRHELERVRDALRDVVRAL